MKIIEMTGDEFAEYIDKLIAEATGEAEEDDADTDACTYSVRIEVQQKKEQKKDEDFGAGALERLAWIQGYCHTHTCPECHFAIEMEDAWHCRIAEATGGMVPEYWELQPARQ